MKMRILRRIRNLFRRDYMEHDHSTREGTLMPTIGQMERIQRGEQARMFHAKYIGCQDVTEEQRLLPSELVRSLLRSAPRKNKRRVTITFTSEKVYVTDMIYRCGLTSFAMDEIQDLFVDPTHQKVFGFLIKDNHTNRVTYFCYKSSVRHYSSETLEILQAFMMMKQKYIAKNDHDPLHHHQQMPAHQCPSKNLKTKQAEVKGKHYASGTKERKEKGPLQIPTAKVLTHSTSEANMMTVPTSSPAHLLTRSLSSPSLLFYVCDEGPKWTPTNTSSADWMAPNEQEMVFGPFQLSVLSTEQTAVENTEMKKYGADFKKELDLPPPPTSHNQPPRKRIHPSILKIVKKLEQVQHPYCSPNHFSPPDILDSSL